MQCWLVADAPLKDETNTRKLLTVPTGTVVALTGRTANKPYHGKSLPYSEVVYSDGLKQTTGWLYNGYLEDYVEEFPAGVVKVLNATPNPNDGAQYLIYRGNTQYNLCGEMCVAHCAGWDLDVESFLDAWSTKAPSFFQRTFQGNKSRGTGLEDLDSMLSIFQGYTLPALRLSDHFCDDVTKLTLVTPGRMEQLLLTHKVIISVHIDGRFGNLKRSGILHWVVLEQVVPDGIGRGYVRIYNPFPNRRQRYIWNEFMESAGMIYGIAVERN